MKRFTDAGRKAIKADNLYCALSLALMIPDICGSLEDPGPNKSRERYERWCKQWVEPKFTRSLGPNREKMILISAEDCFQLRCSLVHSGSADIAADKQKILSRFEFVDRTAGVHMMWVEGLTINGVLQPNFLRLKADLFSEDMFKSADEWDAATKNEANIQREKAKLLVIRTKGDATLGGVISFG